MIACAAAPGGVLPAGPGLAGAPGALGGTAYGGSLGTAGGAAFGGGAGGFDSGAAAGGFGGAAGGGLATGAGLLASAALIAGGLATTGSFTPAPVARQQAPTVQLARAGLPFITAPLLPSQVPGTVAGRAPGKNAGFAAPRGTAHGVGMTGGPLSVPEPASIGLLAAGAIAALLARRNARHA